MENHGNPKSNEEVVQVMTSLRRLQPPKTTLLVSRNRRPGTKSDALSRWEEFRLSKSIESLRR